MALILKKAPAAHGARWVTQGFALFGRRPLAFSGLFVVFLFAALVVSLVPVIGGLLQMMLLPLLSLGFMVAAHSAHKGGPVHPGQFIEPLRPDPQRRRALLLLCLAYGVAAVLILLLANLISDNALARLQNLMASQDTKPEEIDAIFAERGVAAAALLGTTLATLLSVPFWHAPALVHWGRQGVGQALFSSTLAVWRNKGAFLVYGLTWMALIMGFGVLVALLFGLLGARALGPMVAMPAALIFSTVFYLSLLASFQDSFGESSSDATAAAPAPQAAPPPQEP